MAHPIHPPRMARVFIYTFDSKFGLVSVLVPWCLGIFNYDAILICLIFSLPSQKNVTKFCLPELVEGAVQSGAAVW